MDNLNRLRLAAGIPIVTGSHYTKKIVESDDKKDDDAGIKSKYKALLAKYGAKSVADLSDDNKVRFHDEVEKLHCSDEEEASGECKDDEKKEDSKEDSKDDKKDKSDDKEDKKDDKEDAKSDDKEDKKDESDDDKDDKKDKSDDKEDEKDDDKDDEDESDDKDDDKDKSDKKKDDVKESMMFESETVKWKQVTSGRHAGSMIRYLGVPGTSIGGYVIKAPDGTLYRYNRNHKLHSENGPAVIWPGPDKKVGYYINGNKVNPEEIKNKSVHESTLNYKASNEVSWKDSLNPVNTLNTKEIDTYYGQEVKGDNKQDLQQDRGDDELEAKIKVPANIKSDLKARIDELKSECEKHYKFNRSMDGDLCDTTATAFEYILDCLNSGTVMDMKKAQIHMTSLMGPIVHRLPNSVQKYLARGGANRSLKDRMTEVKQKNPIKEGMKMKLNEINYQQRMERRGPVESRTKFTVHPNPYEDGGYIKKYEDGEVRFYDKEKRLHRYDGPAVIVQRPTQQYFWFVNGEPIERPKGQ